MWEKNGRFGCLDSAGAWLEVKRRNRLWRDARPPLSENLFRPHLFQFLVGFDVGRRVSRYIRLRPRRVMIPDRQGEEQPDLDKQVGQPAKP